MRVPLQWLREFVDIDLPADTLAHQITMAGLEVAKVEYIGVEGAELPWEPEQVVIGHVLEVRPHPNADKLVIADVDYGAAEPHVVVTGAPNLFPYKGQGRLETPLVSVFAKEGTRLYDGHKEGKVIMTLKGRPVRGVMSNAMLCSEKELGMSDEHEGIILLDEDIPAGTPARDVLGDVVLDIDITPNLARCLSLVGVAREVAAITNKPLHIPTPEVQMDGPAIEGRAKVTIEDENLCYRFTAGLIEGITIKSSPSWMQRRLRYAGMRPINNIVDISNYVMLEWGEPTHAFDADKVEGQHLITRIAKPGERLTTLDGKTHDLPPATPDQRPPLLVCDPTGPLAIAGVMGGEDSEVRDTTTRVLLEAAIWEPRQVRRTAQRFKIPSEASRRFERGVDVNIALAAQHRALELMRQYAGGTVAKGLIDVFPKPWQPMSLELCPSEITRLIDIRLSADEIGGILQSLGFECEICRDSGMGDLAGYAVNMGLDPATVRVTVPSFRQDVTMLADLCEEVARIYGYDEIPATRLADRLPPADVHPDVEREWLVRDVLVGCGLYDLITYSLTNMESVALLNPSEAVEERYFRLSNAISPERQYLQRSMLPSLVEAVSQNLRERDRAKVFEIGHVFLRKEQRIDEEITAAATDSDEGWLPEERRRLGIAMAGPRQSQVWCDTSEASKTPLDFFDMKGVIETLLSRLGLETTAVFEPLTDDERFHPGRAAKLFIEQPVNTNPASSGKKKKKAVEMVREQVGVFGELHPDACERFEIAVPRVVAAEIDLDLLFGLVKPQTHAHTTLSRYPATMQDLAIVAAHDIPAEQVAALIRRGAGDLLEQVTLFDVYTGPQVGEGKRSLAYRLAFRSHDRTLSDNELSKVRTKIIKVLEKELQATIRA